MIDDLDKFYRMVMIIDPLFQIKRQSEGELFMFDVDTQTKLIENANQVFSINPLNLTLVETMALKHELRNLEKIDSNKNHIVSMMIGVHYDWWKEWNNIGPVKWLSASNCSNMLELLVKYDFFKSQSDAKRNGWKNTPIVNGLIKINKRHYRIVD